MGSFIDEKRYLSEVPDHFKCPICLFVASDMVEHTFCDTIFCKECLSQYLDSPNKNKNCPYCNIVMPKKSVKPANRILRAQFNDLLLRCINSPDCEMVATRSELNVHEKSCIFNPIVCDLCHATYAWNGFEDHRKYDCIDRLTPCQFCGIEVKLNEHDKHKQLVCLVAPKACKYCKEQITLSSQNEHDKVCKSFPIACTNEGCVDKISRLNYQQHVKSRCPFRLESCFQCKRKVAFSTLQEHISRHCELTKIVCKCGLKLTRGDEAAHFEQDCPTYVVSCPHDGCSYSTARSDLSSHIADCRYRPLSNEEMLRDKRCRYDKLKHSFSVVNSRISLFCDVFPYYEKLRQFRSDMYKDDLTYLSCLIDLREESGLYCRNLKQRTPGYPDSALVADIPNVGLVADLITVKDWRDVYTISWAAGYFMKCLILLDCISSKTRSSFEHGGILWLCVSSLPRFQFYDVTINAYRPRKRSELKSKRLPFNRLLSIDRGNPRYIANIVELKPEHECLRDTVVYAIFKDSILFDTNDSANEYLDLCKAKQVSPPTIYTRNGCVFQNYVWRKRPLDGFEFQFKITNENPNNFEDMKAVEAFEKDCHERASIYDNMNALKTELLESGISDLNID